MEIKPIRMTINAGLDTKDDALASLDVAFRSVADAVQNAYRERYAGATGGAATDAIALLAVVGDFLAVMSRLDGQYGANAELPVADATEAADEKMQ